MYSIDIHNFVLGKMEEKGKGRGWGGGWVQGARAPGGAGGPRGGAYIMHEFLSVYNYLDTVPITAAGGSFNGDSFNGDSFNGGSFNGGSLNFNGDSFYRASPSFHHLLPKGSFVPVLPRARGGTEVKSSRFKMFREPPRHTDTTFFTLVGSLCFLESFSINPRLFNIQETRFKIQDVKIQDVKIQDSIFNIQDSRFKIQYSRFKIQDVKIQASISAGDSVLG